MNEAILSVCLLLVVAAPFASFCAIVVPVWTGHPLSERLTRSLVGGAFASATLAALVATGLSLGSDAAVTRLAVGHWFAVGSYAFTLELTLDRLSGPLAVLAAGLVGVVAAFSSRYLHRQAGFTRFHALLCLFGGAIQLVILAGSLDLMFVGWELVGVSSALLIAFFHERATPVRHGLRTFLIYRTCDVGLLTAIIWLHHTTGSVRLSSTDPGFAVLVASPGRATLVGLLLLWATLGKSAMLPFGGWLPRAMEGPTPSSAIFYGALSVHLGPYLLLRAAPVFEASPVASAALIAVGASTALHATVVGRVQTDIKSALAYATMTQLGLIFVEIGLGLRVLPVIHIMGHACLRTLQILRSPSALHDHHQLENAIGCPLPRTGGHLERWIPRRLQLWLYRHALERGYLDAFLNDQIVERLLRGLRRLDALEEAWVALLGGASKPQPSEQPLEGPGVVR